LTVLLSDLNAKRLEILTETVPQVHRVGDLLDRIAPSHRPFLQAAETACAKLGLQLRTVVVNATAEFEGPSRRWPAIVSAQFSFTRPRKPFVVTALGFWPSSPRSTGCRPCSGAEITWRRVA